MERHQRLALYFRLVRFSQQAIELRRDLFRAGTLKRAPPLFLHDVIDSRIYKRSPNENLNKLNSGRMEQQRLWPGRTFDAARTCHLTRPVGFFRRK